MCARALLCLKGPEAHKHQASGLGAAPATQEQEMLHKQRLQVRVVLQDDSETSLSAEFVTVGLEESFCPESANRQSPQAAIDSKI